MKIYKCDNCEKVLVIEQDRPISKVDKTTLDIIERNHRLECSFSQEKGWKFYNGNEILRPHSKGFYQKKIYNDIYAELQIYDGGYELEIQIPEDKSVVNMTINTCVFSYRFKNKIDFIKLEEDSITIIKKLCKK